MDTYGAVKNLMNISVYEYLFKQYFIMHFASTKSETEVDQYIYARRIKLWVTPLDFKFIH